MDGVKLKSLRIKKGFSLSMLSKLTGISKSYLSAIEHNTQSNPSLEILEKLSDALEIEVEELIKRDKTGPRTLNTGKQQITGKFKVEFEFSNEQFDSNKLKQIEEFIKKLNSSL